MILTGPSILKLIRSGSIRINPFESKYVNQASVDLTLGRDVLTYRHPQPVGEGDRSIIMQPELDVKREQATDRHTIPDEGFLLIPGSLYLMHTVESVSTDDYVICIDGKSSIGRLGVLVHFTAGFVDPGFVGQYTLEVASLTHPVRVYAGMRICQIRFHSLAGEVESYQERGCYVGNRATGPVASQSWRQFK